MIPESTVTFAGSYLDRADRLRGDAAALARLAADAGARALPVWHGKPLFDLTGDGPHLAWLRTTDPLIADGAEPLLFLGLDPDGAAHFAADVSSIAPPDATPAEFVDRRTLDLSETRKFVDLRSIMGDISHRDADIAATTKGVFEWRLTHGFCANCGGRNAVGHGGWRMECTACGRFHFPRTDPVVIMLVLDGDRVLLGRQAAWPEGMYSLLAGFMEPGEGIEDAVRREVAEEAGIRIADVGYAISQPWPFPASLMIGCVARAVSTEITLDPVELEAAIWVSRDEMADALAGRHHVIAPPRRGALAQVMLAAWVSGALQGVDQFVGPEDI